MSYTGYAQFDEEVQPKPSTWNEKLKSLLYFDTIKFVTVHSLKLGTIHRSIQVAVLLYIVLYSIWLSKGYQEHTNANGVVFTKVKGLGYTNESDSISIYDSSDLVTPPTEPNAIFIITAMLVTNQQSDTVCTAYDTYNCTKDEDCQPGLTSIGEILPSCNLTSGYCLLRGWCPLENDTTEAKTVLQGLESVTLFVRSSVVYDRFNVQVSDAVTPVPGINLFSLKDMLDGFTIQNCSLEGCIVRIEIDWTCDLDQGNCTPKFVFRRSPDGFNYRNVVYDNKQNQRELSKLYGIRFLISITGIGARFSFFQTVITLGSGAAFFTLATVITDVLLLITFRGSELVSKKYAQFSLPSE